MGPGFGRHWTAVAMVVAAIALPLAVDCETPPSSPDRRLPVTDFEKISLLRRQRAWSDHRGPSTAIPVDPTADGQPESESPAPPRRTAPQRAPVGHQLQRRQMFGGFGLSEPTRKSGIEVANPRPPSDNRGSGSSRDDDNKKEPDGTVSPIRKVVLRVKDALYNHHDNNEKRTERTPDAEVTAHVAQRAKPTKAGTGKKPDKHGAATPQHLERGAATPQHLEPGTDQRVEVTTEKRKLESTTQDRSIVHAPDKSACGNGLVMNPDRNCVAASAAKGEKFDEE